MPFVTPWRESHGAHAGTVCIEASQGATSADRPVDILPHPSERGGMRALALEHLRSNPIGVYGDILGERGIAVERVRLEQDESLPDWRSYDLVVVMGGGMSVYEEAEYPWLAEEKQAVGEAVRAGIPYFGVCLGSQLLAAALGARVYRGPEPELGVSPVFLSDAAKRDPVFRGFPSNLEVFEWHSDTFELPEGAVRLARSPRYENQALRYGRVAYAIDRKSTRLNSSHLKLSRMPSSA